MKREPFHEFEPLKAAESRCIVSNADLDALLAALRGLRDAASTVLVSHAGLRTAIAAADALIAEGGK